jgi:hypothetical protein
MSVPDNDLIAEVLLVSEGFNTARDLARKMVSLFQVGGGCECPQKVTVPVVMYKECAGQCSLAVLLYC